METPCLRGVTRPYAEICDLSGMRRTEGSISEDPAILSRGRAGQRVAFRGEKKISLRNGPANKKKAAFPNAALPKNKDMMNDFLFLKLPSNYHQKRYE